ncbi:M16 family metallopeptidase [Helicobacter anatolicus]|uniref:M16 family metallopeptidase n=1 Tax=Helicobacter anatolicus TaxID=2905874 RepID=UPI001E2FD7D3|nr:pitrilysin family protein [Helicobacter anatolicus]MCE3038831.1 insulinase family protein [Helicobacter anatolicus]
MKKIFLVFVLFLGVNMQANEVSYIKINNQQIPVIFEHSSLIPVGFLRLSFLGGGSVNDGELSGLSLLSASLLNEGTKTLGVIKFSEELDKRAIEISAISGAETLNIEVQFLKEKQGDALKLLGDLLYDPNYSDETLKKIKENAINRLLIKENDFDYIASKNLSAMLFQNTPFAKNMTPATLNKITLEDIKGLINKNFTLSRLVITFGGDIQKDEFLKSLENILSKMPLGIPNTSVKYHANAQSQTKVVHKQTDQTYIYFGAPFNLTNIQDEGYKAKILSFVLGASGFGSRIMEEIRVKRGLAYSAYLRINIEKMMNYASGYLQTKLENQEQAIALVKEIVARFVQDGITQEELDSAKQFLLGSQPLREETLSQRLEAKFFNYLLGLPLDFNKTQLQQIQEVSLEEINAYIKKHTELNNLSFSIVTLEEKK